MSGTKASFLPLGTGRRFCLVHGGAKGSPVSGAMLYVHPFAEEMNKSRRMAALQSRALAAAGWTVLQLDLYGCGDSEGEFGDASWSQWLDDVGAAVAWLRGETGLTPVLWGMRTGCLLVTQAIRSMVPPASEILLWQPVISGKRYLQQFLRTHVAGQLTNVEGMARTGTQQLREQLGRGQQVEVGGYATSAPLALGMEEAEMTLPTTAVRVAWLEVAASASSGLSLASSQRVEAWRAAGHIVDARVVDGLPFWQTQEVAECHLLIDATVQAVDAWRR